MEYIAHRGCADQFPENTLAAVRGCADHVDRIELDAFRCGSGEVVLFHDRSTAALTDGEYDVTETDYDVLRELRVLGSDQRIPLLAEACEAMPTSVGVHVDLKQRGIADAVAAVTAGFDHEVYVCSTDPDALAEAASASWDATLGYVAFGYFQTDEDADPGAVTDAELRDALDTAVDLDCSFVEVPQGLCVETDVVTLAHDRGLDVVTWTIRTAGELSAVADAGVDGAMVDRIDIL